MGEVGWLFLATRHGAAVNEVPAVEAIAGRGFRGCIHGRAGGRRQVLLVDEETLTGLALAPGVVKENITTRGIAVGKLSAGQRIVAGGAVLEVTGPCAPCRRMEEIRGGLQEELRGRRGMLCRVVSDGLIRRGDPILAKPGNSTNGGQS